MRVAKKANTQSTESLAKNVKLQTAKKVKSTQNIMESKSHVEIKISVLKMVNVLLVIKTSSVKPVQKVPQDYTQNIVYFAGTQL